MPHNPAAVHLEPVEIDCPIEVGATVVALRNFRGDPLGWLWSHGQIAKHQYDAGTRYQRDNETLAGDLRAMDPAREYVDGRQAPHPATDRHARARRSLASAHAHLGQEASALAHDVLIHGCSMDEVARKRGLVGRRYTDRFGRQFRQSLDVLAVAYGFATATRH